MYEALVSRHLWKEAWNEEEALVEISLQSGKMFDPEFVDHLMNIQGEVLVRRHRFPDEDV